MEIPRHDDAALAPFAEQTPLRVRRNGCEIVRAIDRQSYLRRGPPDVIASELAHHDALVTLGYPVARILTRGEGWYIEESLGDEHYGQLLERTPPEHPDRPRVFQEFAQLLQRYTEAQLREPRSAIEPETLRARIAFEENEHLFEGDERAQYHEMVDRVVATLDGIPGVPCHGDCSPFNVFPRGVIDFEDTFTGPLGYDVVTSIISAQAFALERDCPGIEMRQRYDFTIDERVALANILSKQTRGEERDVSLEAALVRWAWHVRRMGKMPVIEAFRFRKLQALMRAYLEGTLTVEQALGISPLSA